VRFPQVTGRDLLGHDIALPTGLPAEISVCVLAFRQGQQSEVDAWITVLAAAGLADTPWGELESLKRVVLELPVLSARWQPVRRFIDGGMARSIADPRVLARTITIYGSVDAVCRPLEIESKDHVSVRAVRRDGSVLWGVTGEVQQQWVDDLLAVLDSPVSDV
jgi:hypothetical protein